MSRAVNTAGCVFLAVQVDEADGGHIGFKVGREVRPCSWPLLEMKSDGSVSKMPLNRKY